jgi:hypoxanthine phosphoribosyltransferase
MDLKKVHYSWPTVDAASTKLAVEILNTDWRPNYVVGLTRGGLIPAVMISHLLKIPMYTLKVSLRDDELNDSETNCWMPEDVVNGMNILIVDDINDSGETLKWIRSNWHDSVAGLDLDPMMWWHDRVRVAVLIDNLASGERVDFAALEINKAEDPCWIVFPWEK